MLSACCRRYYCYVKRQMEANVAEGAADARLPMAPPRLMAVIRDVMPEDGITCLDNGLYKVRALPSLPGQRPVHGERLSFCAWTTAFTK
jgi:hypothetical protein